MFRAETGRDPISGARLPSAIKGSADLPNAAADADEPAIVEIDVSVAFDDVDTQMGIELKLPAALVVPRQYYIHQCNC